MTTSVSLSERLLRGPKVRALARPSKTASRSTTERARLQRSRRFSSRLLAFGFDEEHFDRAYRRGLVDLDVALLCLHTFA